MELPRLVKRPLENNVGEEDETHTFRQVDMCKWQMNDPEIQMKFSLSDCTWLEDLSMEQFFKVTWKINEAKKS